MYISGIQRDGSFYQKITSKDLNGITSYSGIVSQNGVVSTFQGYKVLPESSTDNLDSIPSASELVFTPVQMPFQNWMYPINDFISKTSQDMFEQHQNMQYWINSNIRNSFRNLPGFGMGNNPWFYTYPYFGYWV